MPAGYNLLACLTFFGCTPVTRVELELNLGVKVVACWHGDLGTQEHVTACSIIYLKPEKSKNREIEIQPGFTKLGQVCHGKRYGEADPKPRFLRFKVGF